MKNTESLFDEELNRLFETLKKHPVTSQEYYDILAAIDKLCEGRSRKSAKQQFIESFANIGTNLLVVGLMLGFERTGVLTSKALSFLKRS